MKFFSPFFIFVFGALVTPIIGHAVPNVEGGVDVVERDFAGAPAHLFARKKYPISLFVFDSTLIPRSSEHYD
ncbi:hypothetical protein E4U09_005114 [Claviceps aff. purpurea]|uniref:Uncharacterized protein n=1 Tax=Claviceps aff. purpurea TaxID=1967640 RepID=A0A9P7U5T1_9HYPO|nr:hypothetical protein E4U38_008479 [Claviceps purpurea]KAG6161302.1 hypothetical protein E4U11_003570 [Claviceps purpurea]KAG6188925.1 hypothetical protein E4U36_006100 [Claviceps purpurea]KAG6213057.1 hypothetical protein E4U50_001586 [Claviceps purpurea]KAG6301524.1 hypothetical protein E4U09_005114 [Claviceps aff. purpurea]